MRLALRGRGGDVWLKADFLEITKQRVVKTQTMKSRFHFPEESIKITKFKSENPY